MKRITQFIVAILVLLASPAMAQVVPRNPRLPLRLPWRGAVQQIEAVEPSLARHAAIVFSGRVTDVSHIVPDSGSAEPLMQITFVVETGIRGVQNGDQFRLLEWPGRWQAGERYRVGERYLVFLHAPNAAGLTSPVGGNAGRFLMDKNGTVDLTSAQLLGSPGNNASSSSSPATDAPQPGRPLPHLPHPGIPNGNSRVRTE
jgi:hypothetical protein